MENVAKCRIRIFGVEYLVIHTKLPEMECNIINGCESVKAAIASCRKLNGSDTFEPNFSPLLPWHAERPHFCKFDDPIKNPFPSVTRHPQHHPLAREFVLVFSLIHVQNTALLLYKHGNKKIPLCGNVFV